MWASMKSRKKLHVVWHSAESWGSELGPKEELRPSLAQGVDL